MSLFRFTLLDKATQMAGSFGAVVLIGALAPTDAFTQWSLAIGLFASLAPFFYALPAETLIRQMGKTQQNEDLAPLLGRSLLARSLWATVICVCTTAYASQLSALGGGVTTTLLVLMLGAGLAETMAFSYTLLIRQNLLQTALVGRMLAMALKLMATAACLWWNGRPTLLALAYSLDALFLMAWSAYALLRSGTVNASQLRIWLVRHWALDGVREAINLLSRSLPATALIIGFNLSLRTDRLLSAHWLTKDQLSSRSVCMQFVDPLVMLFVSYLGARYVQNAEPSSRWRLRAMSGLLCIAFFGSWLGPWVFEQLPANFASRAPLMGQCVWYLPAYGILALLVYPRFFAHKTVSAAIILCSFVIMQILCDWVLAQAAPRYTEYSTAALAILIGIKLLVDTRAR